MLDIKLTGINYRIDENGNTTEVGASFSGYANGENVNANMVISAADLEEGTTLDDLSRKQIEAAGRKKLADITVVKSETTTTTTEASAE